MTTTNQERFMLDEAEQAQRRLGDELIAAARLAIDAWRALYDPPEGPTPIKLGRMHRAIDRLEELVGRP